MAYQSKKISYEPHGTRNEKLLAASAAWDKPNIPVPFRGLVPVLKTLDSMWLGKFCCWSITDNMITKARYKQILDLCDVSKLTAGREKNQKGEWHGQHAVTFKHAKRLRQMIEMLPGMHIEVAKSPDDLHNYCTKDCDYIRIDKSVGHGRRTDLVVLQEAALAGVPLELMIRQHPEVLSRHYKYYREMLNAHRPARTTFTKGVYIWGPPDLGKSHAVRLAFPMAMHVDLTNGFYSGDMSSRVLVFDDFNPDDFTNCQMKKLLNHIPFMANVKGGFTQLRPLLVIFLHNDPPPDAWDAGTLSRITGNRGRTIKWSTLETIPDAWPLYMVGQGGSAGSTFVLPFQSDDDFILELKVAHDRSVNALSFVPAAVDPDPAAETALLADVAEGPPKKKARFDPTPPELPEGWDPRFDSESDTPEWEQVQCVVCKFMENRDQTIYVDADEFMPQWEHAAGPCCQDCVHRGSKPGTNGNAVNELDDDPFANQFVLAEAVVAPPRKEVLVAPSITRKTGPRSSPVRGCTLPDFLTPDQPIQARQGRKRRMAPSNPFEDE